MSGDLQGRITMTDDATTPAPPPPPSVPQRGVLDSLDVTPPALVRAVRVGALTYAVAWLAGIVATLLALALAVIDDSVDDVSFWWLVTAPGQLVAMAFRSPAVMSVSSSDEDFAFAGSTSTTAPVLTILAIALIAAFRLSRRDETTAPSPSTTAAVTLAAVAATTFAVIAWLIALVLKVSIDEGDGGVTFGAGRFEVIAFGFIAVTAVSLIGRRSWSTWPSAAAIPLAARDAWRGAVVHLAVFSGLTIPAAAIWVVVQGEPGSLLLLPVVAGNVIVYAVTLGHFGALNLSFGGGLLDESVSASTNFWLVSEGADPILWILVPFAVIGVLASAVVLHERGKGHPRTDGHWVWAAVVYAAVGGALTFLGTLSSGLASSVGVGGSGSVGPAAWFLLVFAAWGMLAELLARTVGPTLAGALPATWVSRAAGEAGPVRTGVDPGAPAPAAGVPAAAAPAAPLDPRAKRILLAVGGVVVAAVVAVIGVSVANSVFFGPGRQVEAYFDALEKGDADGALDLVRLDYSDDERVLLTDDVLGEGGGIADVEIGDVDTNGDLAVVTVDYTVDGADQSQDVTLRRSGRYVVFDDWELVDPDLGSVEVTATGATGLVVNGHEVEVDGLDDTVELPVFPGSYEIQPTAGSSFLEFGPQEVSVGTDGEYLDFDVIPSDALLAEVTEQANAFVAECVSRTDADPAGCPNETYGYELEDVRWTLDAPPTYEVESDYEGGWRFSTSLPGRASVTAQQPSFIDGEPAEDYADDVSISIDGTVTIDGDIVTVDVDDSYF
jgi:hypothetical protein